MTDFIKSDAIWNPNETEAGVAYALFNSSADIPYIGDIALEVAEQTDRNGDPSKLELALVEVKDFKEEQNPELHYFINDNQIRPIFPSDYAGPKKEVAPTKLADLKYALMVARRGKTDKEIADYLGNVMNDVWETYDPGKPFNAAVVYRNPKDGFLDFKRD
jgi:hypothetical protein